MEELSSDYLFSSIDMPLMVDLNRILDAGIVSRHRDRHPFIAHAIAPEDVRRIIEKVVKRG